MNDIQGETVSPEGLEILQRLIEGNKRFVAGVLQHPRQDAHTRAEVARGQHPDVILVTCSDSRVAPDCVFDAGLGDIFSIENAGGLVIAAGEDTSLDIASVEYMVQRYEEEGRCGALVVMGHTHCGAIFAAVHTPEGKSAGSPHLDLLVQSVRENIPFEVLRDPGPGLERAVKANNCAVLNSLLEKSAIVRHALESGHLVAVQATYELESGQVIFTMGSPR